MLSQESDQITKKKKNTKSNDSTKVASDNSGKSSPKPSGVDNTSTNQNSAPAPATQKSAKSNTEPTFKAPTPGKPVKQSSNIPPSEDHSTPKKRVNSGPRSKSESPAKIREPTLIEIKAKQKETEVVAINSDSKRRIAESKAESDASTMNSQKSLSDAPNEENAPMETNDPAEGGSATSTCPL